MSFVEELGAVRGYKQIVARVLVAPPRASARRPSSGAPTRSARRFRLTYLFVESHTSASLPTSAARESHSSAVWFAWFFWESWPL